MDLFGLFSSDILGVRLASANNDPFQGPVEVFHNGSWRKVCGDSDWDLRDANVVCRELGFAGALVADKTTSSARGNEKIWMTCTGNEKSWTECHGQSSLHYHCYDLFVCLFFFYIKAFAIL